MPQSFSPQLKVVQRLILKAKKARGGRPFKSKRVPRQPSIKTLERSYFRDLKEMIDDMKALVDRLLVPALPSIQRAFAAVKPKADHARADDFTDDVERIMASIRENFYREYDDNELRFFAMKAAKRTEEFNAESFQRQFKAVFGIQMPLVEPYLEPTIKGFVKQNVSLIKSIPDTYFNRVENTVLRDVQAGTLTSEIAQEIQTAYDVSESKATLIARDQTAKLNGNLNQMRQTEVGVSKYEWSTSMDERVRESHAAKEGQVYSWSDPPADTGHPGEDYQCRCTAIPVFEEIAEEEAA